MVEDQNLRPQDSQQIEDIIAFAVSEKKGVEIIGHGSKRDIGHEVNAAYRLDMSDIRGIDLYEPAELVLGARAATPIVEIRAALAEYGQELPFDPPDFSALLKGTGAGTFAGTLMSNLSGSKRLKNGAARDFVLGVSAISGRGEAFKAGGRVVKNVTGYDVARGLCGSWGTLAIALSFNIKIMPKAEREETVIFDGLSDHAACLLMSQALASPYDVVSAAHIPGEAARRMPGIADGGKKAKTLIRIEGPEKSVRYRSQKITAMADGDLTAETISAAQSELIWRQIRDVNIFASSAHPVWRISCPPICGAEFTESLRQKIDFDYYFDWAGGLVWIETIAPNAHREIRQALVENGGGHATLIRADGPMRRAVPVFQPLPDALAALSARLKSQFDPENILNPGKMYPIIGAQAAIFA